MDSCRHRVDRYCSPRYEVMWMGVPIRAIQLLRRARTRVRADVSVTGVASGHRLNLSIMVKISTLNNEKKAVLPLLHQWVEILSFRL